METSDDKKQCESEKSTLSDEKEEEGKIYFFYICFMCNIYKKKIFLTYINCIITTCKKRLFYQLCQLQAKKNEHDENDDDESILDG